MNNFQLQEVKGKKEIKLFHAMARPIYAEDPNWVQPLVGDIEHIFDPAHNKLFNSDGAGQAIRWIVRDTLTGEIVGRIAAFYNRSKAEAENQLTGGCGFFESADNQEVANILFDAARDWLVSRGMEAMDGPINFGDRLQWWGLLVEGFTQPLYGMAYARPYYKALFENYGFQVYFNQITYLRPFDPKIRMPEALYAKAERLYENPEYEFRTFDKKNPEKMARDFCAVYNSGWAKFQGVKPMTDEGALAMMREMSPIIDTEVLYLSYHNDRPVGFFVMLPDLNCVIGNFKGKFGLWQKLQLLLAIRGKKINRLSGLIFGVASEYQGKGIEAGMIRQLEIYLLDRIARNKVQYNTLEMGWIGDFNPVMMRMCESYVKATPFKKHVTYRYLFDRTRPFERCARLK